MNHLTDDQLNEYLDEFGYTGTPDTSHLTPATSHLATCNECRARLDDLRAVFTALESLPEVQPLHDLTAAILAKATPAQNKGMLRRSPALIWLLSVQAVASFALVAWLVRKIDFQAIPSLQLPTLEFVVASIFSLFTSLFSSLASFTFQIPTFELPPLVAPVFHLPPLFAHFPSFNLQPLTSRLPLLTPNLALLISAIILLGLAGNGLLLRPPAPRSKK